MEGDREQKIREHAHAIWQGEGEPHGRHDDHWQQASREVDDQSASTDAAPAKPASPKKTKRSVPKIDAAVPDTSAKAPRTARAKKSAS